MATLKIPNKLAVNISVISVASLGFIGYGTFSVLSATKDPQIVAEAVTKCEPSWLLSPEPSSNSAFNAEQLRLYLFNQDPSACTTGLVFGLIDQSAQDMIAQASLAVQTSGNPCFKLSKTQCLYRRFEQIEKGLSDSKTPLDKSRVIAQLAALNRALDAVAGKVTLGTGGEVGATISLLIQRSRQNARSEQAETIEGQSDAEIRKRKDDEQAAEDANKGFSLDDNTGKEKGTDDRRDKAGKRGKK